MDSTSVQVIFEGVRFITWIVKKFFIYKFKVYRINLSFSYLLLFFLFKTLLLGLGLGFCRHFWCFMRHLRIYLYLSLATLLWRWRFIFFPFLRDICCTWHDPLFSLAFTVFVTLTPNVNFALEIVHENYGAPCSQVRIANERIFGDVARICSLGVPTDQTLQGAAFDFISFEIGELDLIFETAHCLSKLGLVPVDLLDKSGHKVANHTLFSLELFDLLILLPLLALLFSFFLHVLIFHGKFVRTILLRIILLFIILLYCVCLGDQFVDHLGVFFTRKILETSRWNCCFLHNVIHVV